MKLRVTTGGRHTTNGHYCYEVAVNKQRPTRADVDRLMQLRSRIEDMAQRQLGSRFVWLRPVVPKNIARVRLDLCVKTGTSRSEKRFDLRFLFGWIELFDTETQAA